MAIYGSVVNSDASGPFSFRNKIINGAMEIDQRNAGAASTTDGAYTLDRWQSVYYGTGSTQRIAMSNPAEVPGFRYYTKFIRTGSGNNYSSFQQKIENTKALSGQAMTFSFWVRGDVINASGWSAWAASYKDDGTFIAYSPNNGTIFTITGTWTKVTMRMDVPSITVDPGSGGGYFLLMFRCSSPTENFNISTTGWQWEQGTVATPFEYRPIGTELALCQRYYEISNGDGSLWSGSAGGASNGWSEGRITFMVQKRVTPTMSIGYSTIGDNNVTWDATGSANQTISSSVGTTTPTFSKVTKSSGLAYIPYQIILKWAASAEL